MLGNSQAVGQFCEARIASHFDFITPIPCSFNAGTPGLHARSIAGELLADDRRIYLAVIFNGYAESLDDPVPSHDVESRQPRVAAEICAPHVPMSVQLTSVRVVTLQITEVVREIKVLRCWFDSCGSDALAISQGSINGHHVA